MTQPKVYVFKHITPSIDDISAKFKISQKEDQKSDNPALGSTESSQSKLRKLSLLLDQQQQKETDLINRNYYGNQN